MKVASAEFVTSAAAAAGLPRDALPQLAFVGRSNVGKSTLINALAGKVIARTSAAPGKTRLINLYRIDLGPFAPVGPFYLVDLPGYGYARGGERAQAQFASLMEEYFDLEPASPGASGATGGPSGAAAALLIVDARHPGLPQDVAAWTWIERLERPHAVVASKVDKLSRGERARALNQWTQSLKTPVLAVSAATGEGLEDLWTTIARLLPPRRKKTPETPSSPSRPSGPNRPHG